MNQAIQDFIDGKRIAVVGASRSGKKFGNTASVELKSRGYQIFLVHPEAKEITGEPCYPSLASLQEKVDGVWICVPPKQSGQVLREAVEAGFTKIWLQPGSESPEVLALAKDLGVAPVSGKCILMYAPPVRSFHRWHRAFAKLFGQF